MGMYTELNMGIEIKPIPEVIKKLKYMLRESEEDVEISHPLFSNETIWKGMLRSHSYYFDGQPDSKLYHDKHDWWEKYFLNIRTNLKNYAHEIELFLDWLCPYIITDGFLGYTRYEEDYDPTLIYKEKGKIVCRAIKGKIVCRAIKGVIE